DSIRPSSLALRSLLTRSLGRLIASFSVPDILWLYRCGSGASTGSVIPGFPGRPVRTRSASSGGELGFHQFNLHSHPESAKQGVGTLTWRVTTHTAGLGR